MTEPKTNRIPAPLYAAAGASDLALQQLRKLPTLVSERGGEVAADLGGKAVVAGFELRQKASETLRAASQAAADLRQRSVSADLDRLREAADFDRLREATDPERLRELATRNAAAVVAGAQAAQERALAAYAQLVARGERVVGAGVLEAADTVNADIEATEAQLNAAPATAPAMPGAEAPSAAPALSAAEVPTEVEVGAAEVPSPADVAEAAEAKPAARAARTRATKATTTQATKATAGKTTKATKATDSKAAATKARKGAAGKATASEQAAEPGDTPSAKLPKTRRTRPAAD